MVVPTYCREAITLTSSDHGSIDRRQGKHIQTVNSALSIHDTVRGSIEELSNDGGIDVTSHLFETRSSAMSALSCIMKYSVYRLQ